MSCLELAPMVDWGRLHARAYLDTLETELGVSFNIDVSQSPRQPIVDIQMMSAQQVIGWEEQAVGQVLTDYLASPDGQARLRRYNESGWQAIPRGATVTI